MSVEFIGMIATQEVSEIKRRPGPVIDPEFISRFVRAHEDAEFDRVLIGYGAGHPEGLQVAAYAAAHSERLGFLVAHRPGFIAPTVAARHFATLDQLSRGRAAIHVITGGSDTEQRRDGDYLPKDERYDRSDEFLDVLKLTWTSAGPFDYQGRHYRLEDYRSDFTPFQQPHPPIYFGGSSDAAFRVGAKHADVFALWGEPLAETAEQIEQVRVSSAAIGRSTPPRISVSFRPIVAPTDDLAWERAQSIRQGIESGPGGAYFKQMVGRIQQAGGPEAVGSQRLLAAAAKAERHDRALWTPLAAATGAPGNSTALVGSPETVAAAILDYVDLGVTTILIRGYDPYDDAIDYGRHVLPLVRQEIAHRALTRAGAGSEPVVALP